MKSKIKKKNKHQSPQVLLNSGPNSTPKEYISYFGENSGNKAGLPFVKDHYIYECMDKIHGRWRWGHRVIAYTDIKEATETGHVIVHVEIWWLDRKDKERRISDIGESDVEIYRDRNNAPRLASDYWKGAVTDAVKKQLGDRKRIASDVYDGKIPKKIFEFNETKSIESNPKTLLIDNNSNSICEK